MRTVLRKLDGKLYVGLIADVQDTAVWVLFNNNEVRILSKTLNDIQKTQYAESGFSVHTYDESFLAQGLVAYGAFYNIKAQVPILYTEFKEADDALSSLIDGISTQRINVGPIPQTLVENLKNLNNRTALKKHEVAGILATLVPIEHLDPPGDTTPLHSDPEDELADAARRVEKAEEAAAAARARAVAAAAAAAAAAEAARAGGRRQG